MQPANPATVATTAVVDQIDALDARLKDEFRAFLFVIWQHLGLPPPSEIQNDIAKFIAGGPTRRMVMAFRGVGKSWLTAAYVLWRLFRNPEERVLVVSANENKAVEFATFVRRLIDEVPILQFLRPAEGQRDSVLSFDVGPASAHQSPSVRAVGIGGQITGGRATIVIFDDVEVPKNSQTQTMRDRLGELVKEAAAVVVPEGYDIIYLGTPQTEDSLYAKLPDRGYTIRMWPARLPKNPDVYAGRLAPLIQRKLRKGIPGSVVDPTRFHEEALVAAELEYGRAGFALQFMLDTTLSDVEKYPLKLADAIAMALDAELAPAKVAHARDQRYLVTDIESVGMKGDRWYGPAFITEKDWTNYQGIVMAVDPSGRGGDELAYAVVAMLHGYLYVLACRGLRGGPNDANLEHIAKAAARWKVREVIVEENFGDGMFTQLLHPHLERHHPVTTTEVKHSIQKEKRICDVLEPIFLQHRIIFSTDLIRDDATNYNEYPAEHAHKYQLFHQITRITRDRDAIPKDDRLDVLAMACQYWVGAMAKDTAMIEEERKVKAANKALEEFMRKAKGGPVGKPTYTTSIHGRRAVDPAARRWSRWTPG